MTPPDRFRASGFGAGTAAAPAVSDALQGALTLHSQGRFQEALEILSGLGDLPTDAYVLRGDLQVELGYFTEAAGSYYTALVLAPANVYARSHLASCLRRLGRLEEAIEALRMVLNADPHRDPIRLELGDCLLRLNRLEPALDCFDQCWSDAAQRPALFGKGVALQLLRRFEEAEIAYERLLALDGKAQEALANLVSMSMEVFDLERVLRYARRLVDINPRSVPGLQGLTLVAVERGDMQTAARHFSALAEVAPEALRPSKEASEDVIEYRVTRNAIDRIKESMRGPAGPLAAQAAARRY
jgi:tetratricopeptide (TPR) repeat protein